METLDMKELSEELVVDQVVGRLLYWILIITMCILSL